MGFLDEIYETRILTNTLCVYSVLVYSHLWGMVYLSWRTHGTSHGIWIARRVTSWVIDYARDNPWHIAWVLPHATHATQWDVIPENDTWDIPQHLPWDPWDYLWDVSQHVPRDISQMRSHTSSHETNCRFCVFPWDPSQHVGRVTCHPMAGSWGNPLGCSHEQTWC